MDTIVAKRIETELVGREVGDWRIEGRIDQGKSAVVFRAAGDGGLAAVKVFDPDMVERYGKTTQLARIERELQLRGRHHPNLIKILGGGECAKTGYLFVAMDLVDAPNLGSVLKSVPPARIWPIISQVASAARFLESLGLAHRDIKAGNIAVSRDYQQAVLLDLGVLRPFGVTGLTDTEKQSFVGTLQYSPPEFLVREEEDSPDGWRAVTFYQLGAVLHDLIMGEPIFANQCESYAGPARDEGNVFRRLPPVACEWPARGSGTSQLSLWLPCEPNWAGDPRLHIPADSASRPVSNRGYLVWPMFGIATPWKSVCLLIWLGPQDIEGGPS